MFGSIKIVRIVHGIFSFQKHQIPINAIPCLNYRKALEKEKELHDQVNGTDETKCPFSTAENKNDETNDSKIIAAEAQGTSSDAKPMGLGPFAAAKIETVKENLQSQSLASNELQQYCSSLFEFKTVRVMRFKSWSARRKFTKNRKQIKNLQRPTLPDGTKLITFPVLATDNETGKSVRTKKEWIMNPNGKSYVCILHEYVQHAFKKQPTYEFKELENAATPYAATVSINDMKYGTGFGTSKKQAKGEAARETLEVLIPEMRDKISTDKTASNNPHSLQKDLSVFDEIRIVDPRVDEFCNKTTEPSPHTLLTTCLKRNYGLGDIKVDYEVQQSRHKKNVFTMTVGKHKATVVCKNKRDGKQLASQEILQVYLNTKQTNHSAFEWPLVLFSDVASAY